MNADKPDVAFLSRLNGHYWTNQDNRRNAYDGRSTGGRETHPLPPQGDRPGPRLVRPGLAGLRVPGDQLRDARAARVYLLRAGVPWGPADHGGDPPGDVGFVPCGR